MSRLKLKKALKKKSRLQVVASKEMADLRYKLSTIHDRVYNSQMGALYRATFSMRATALILFFLISLIIYLTYSLVANNYFGGDEAGEDNCILVNATTGSGISGNISSSQNYSSSIGNETALKPSFI